MKNFLMGLAICSSFICSAVHVSPEQAKSAAITFMAHTFALDRSTLYPTLTETRYSSFNEGSAAYYIFNLPQEGFIIVSADDFAFPILAYSEHGQFYSDQTSASTQKWMDYYADQILHIQQHPSDNLLTNRERWRSLLEGHPSSFYTLRDENDVPALMSTTWNQNPYYNDQCPGGSVTGCVATAMAQVMKYWNHPATGSGFHSYNHPNYGTLSANFSASSYNWSDMPDNVSGPNSAVAQLMYDVGVSVDMQYSPEGSNAFVISAFTNTTNCSEYALKTYFGYQPSMQGLERNNYSNSTWIDMLKSELDASRPIIYAGFGSSGTSGHCFVLDGYDSNNYFHVNWGWGGYQDGYFTVDAMDPSGLGTGGGEGSYNANQQALIGVQPVGGAAIPSSLALYSSLTPNLYQIPYGNSFSVSTNVINSGNSTFNGDLAVGVFNANGVFVDFVQILANNTLPSNNIFTNGLSFTNAGSLSFLPGSYFLSLLYRTSDGNWLQADDNGYSNYVPIEFYYASDIELNSDIVTTPAASVVQGSPLSVNLNVLNAGINTFFGSISANLYTLDGSFVAQIGTYNETNGLSPNYTYISPFLTFTNNAITAEPGTYLLACVYNNGVDDYLVGSTSFQNPIFINVVSSAPDPDIYEANNTTDAAFNLLVNFSGNIASGETTGSNLHIATDIDHYKIILPAGFEYSVTARLHDSYDSDNGQSYTADVLFTYTIDGGAISSVFDDIMSSPISALGGSTIVFKVAPYFAGEVGTYLLTYEITRLGPIGIDPTHVIQPLSVFPNPADNLITIESQSEHIQEYSIVDMTGKIVVAGYSSSQRETIHIAHLDAGIYFLVLSESRKPIKIVKR